MPPARRPLSPKTRPVPPKRNGTARAGNGQRRQTVRASEQHVRQIFNAIHYAVLVVDDQRRFVAANPAAAELMGLPSPALLMRRIDDFVAPGARAGLEQGWQAFLREGKLHGEWSLHRSDGSVREVEYSAHTNILPGQHIGIMHDITERKRAEAMRQASENYLRAIIETEPECVKLLGPGGRLLEMNAAGLAMIEADSFEAVKGHPIYSLIAPEHREAFRRLTDEALHGGQGELEFEIIGLKGTRRWLETHVVPLPDARGQITAALGITRDVTKRKQAEDQLRRATAAAQALARAAGRLNAALDLEAVVQSICEEAAEALNASAASLLFYDDARQVLYHAGSVGLPPEYGRRLRPWLRVTYERYLRVAGSPVHVADVQALTDLQNSDLYREYDFRSVAAARMLRSDQLIGAVVVYRRGAVREFTPDELALLQAFADQAAQAVVNARLFGALQQELTRRTRAEQESHYLLQRLITVQEDERRHLALELHDQLGQHLTALTLIYKSLQEKYPLPPEGEQGRQHVFRLVGETMEVVHRLVTDLRPVALDQLGLVAALQRYAADWSRHTSVVVDFQSHGFQGVRLPAEVEIALYRVVQEALTNVARHAHARRVGLVLQQRRDSVQAIIEDDGQGFEAAARAETQPDQPPLGILGMQERATLLNGSFSIESTPGAGTTVFMRIPLAPGTARGPSSPE